MKKTKVDITMILDRSASMQAMQEEAIESVNDFLSSQKQAKGEARFSLVQFNHYISQCCTGIPIEHAHSINCESYVPSGYTALLDAIGRTIVETKQRIAKKANRQVVFVIVTDGMENASRAFSGKTIKKLIKECEKKLGWRFMFLAADSSSFDQHEAYGFDGKRSLMTGRGPVAYRSAMSVASEKMMHLREDGDLDHLHFSAEDRAIAKKHDLDSDA